MSLLRSRIIPLSLVTLSLIGCGTIDTNMPPEMDFPTQQSEKEVSAIERAIQQAQRQAYPADAAPYYLQAAQLLAEEGDYSKAQQLLEMHVINIDFRGALQGMLLYSDIALAQSNPMLALEALSRARQLPNAEQPRNHIAVLKQRAKVMGALDNWTNTVKDRVQLSLILPPEDQADNQTALWDAVQNLTDNEVAYLETSRLPLLSGWLSISKILRDQALTVEEQLKAFNHWKINNPSHPAALNPPEDFQIMASLDDQMPVSVAVMLPMSKELKVASEAVLNGILQQYYTSTAQRPMLQVIDTDRYSNFEEAYQYAINGGAQTIIGPLRKQNVARLPSLVSNIPTIALNQLDNTYPIENLYHFSLNVTDDIKELITFAKTEGATNASVLSVQDTWAARQSDQFQQLAQELNVPVLQALSYENTPLGRAKAVKQILQIDESEARISKIRQWTKQKVEATPRARQDLDYVFYAGKLEDAKQIRPLLNFYFADNIPMLASQTIHDSSPTRTTKNEDIENIVFTEIPTVVESIHDKQKTPFVLQRLNALGNDSYLLAKRLPLFKHVKSAKLSAKTGIITLDEEGIFNRRPNIVTYKQGVLINAKEEHTKNPEDF